MRVATIIMTSNPTAIDAVLAAVSTATGPPINAYRALSLLHKVGVLPAPVLSAAAGHICPAGDLQQRRRRLGDMDIDIRHFRRRFFDRLPDTVGRRSTAAP